MIFDNFINRKKYFTIHPFFEKAFDFIRKAEQEDLPVGKYEIDGKNLYASVQEYETKAIENAKYEGHDNYIDIQYIVSGKERMDFLCIDHTKSKTDYNPDKDVTFYHNPEQFNTTIVGRGEYCIFFPSDIHMPGLFNDAPATVKKIVVKVRI